MHGTMAYRPHGVSARDRGRTLFGQTMGLVAMVAGFFALGAYAGRNLTHVVAFGAYIAAFLVLLAMRLAARRSRGFSAALLMIFGVLIGAGSSPMLVVYADYDPQVLWQAGGATALFVAAFGSIGYMTRRNLYWLARVSFFALLLLFAFGIVLIFVRIPHGSQIYAGLGLVIFAGLTMADFQRLRRTEGLNSAPFLAASIFLDLLNVFFFFLRIFSREN